MGNASVKEHYETARKTGVFTLSNKLAEFPSKLFELKDVLRTVDLSENKMTELPNAIGDFANLRHLRVNRNKLAILPDTIGKLSKLASFHAADNFLTIVPDTFINLKNLKQINLSGNHIEELPSVFGELKALDVLDLSRNKLTTLPDHVENINVLELILNRNQIREISEGLARCPRLRTLRLEENCLALSAIPRSLLADSTVSVLTVEGNLFEMKELAELDEYTKYMDRYTAMKKKMF